MATPEDAVIVLAQVEALVEGLDPPHTKRVRVDAADSIEAGVAHPGVPAETRRRPDPSRFSGRTTPVAVPLGLGEATFTQPPMRSSPCGPASQGTSVSHRCP